MAKIKVFVTKAEKETLNTYFTHEPDEEIGCHFYKEVKLDSNHDFIKEVIKGVEELYQFYADQEKEVDMKDLKFAKDETGVYKLVITEEAMKQLCSAHLCISYIDDNIENMILVTCDGMSYGDASFYNVLDKDSQKFIDKLITENVMTIEE